ncbi:MAG: hypothetical protein ACYTKD_24905 [Planctomycetota bacterium]
MKTQSNIRTGAPRSSTAPSGEVQPETRQSWIVIGETPFTWRRNAREPAETQRLTDDACSGAAWTSTSRLTSNRQLRA